MAGYDLETTGSGTGVTWYQWVNTSCTTGTTNGIDTGAWGQWCILRSPNTTANTVWLQWTTQTTGQGIYVPTKWVPPPESPEERDKRVAAENAAAEKAAADAKERERKSAEAEKRARELLLENLRPEQAKRFEKDKTFEVLAMSGRRYRIKLGWGGNVEEMQDERVIKRFCLHPRDRVPEHDNVLAQKLLLEHDEEQFLRTANMTPVGVN